jgi:DNA polymerase I
VSSAVARLMILDGNSLTYRAFFALPTDMATASGQVTNAVFGFTSMLINLMKDHQPDRIVVTFDRPEPTFRHEALPSYKAQREATPDILRQQMGLVREVVTALGMTQLELVGWEADDIIATVAEQGKARGDDVIIVTGDRDSYQLVHDPHVKVLYNKRGVSDYAFYDEAGILERTGVTPALYPQYAAMRGDPSDNLPGVPGVGEKTAAKLLLTYGSLDGIFENVEKQTPKLKSSLIENEAIVRKNFELMVLRRDAPIEFDIDELVLHPDLAEVKKLFDFLEFRTLFDRLLAVLQPGVGAPAFEGAVSSGNVVDAEVTRCEKPADSVAALSGLTVLDMAGSWVGEAGRTELLGLAVVTDGESGAVAWIPVEHLAEAKVQAVLLDGRPMRMHEAKPLLRSLTGLGLDVTSLSVDTAIASYLLDPAEKNYDVAALLLKYTGDTLATDGAPSGQLDLDGTAADDAQIAGRAALGVSRLAPKLEAALDAQGMRKLYDEIENPLVRVLARMEDIGVGVDLGELQALNTHLTNEARRLQQECYKAAGKEINLNSPTQLRVLLYDEKQLVPGKKTKTGYSTDAQTLEKLAEEWPAFIEPLMQYREIDKLRGTYGEGLLNEVGPDHRIHATFNQTVARTGRLSSDQPNLHNIPVRSEEGRAFRKAFVAPPGHTLLIADYNQIELRCIAHLAEDPGLVEAFTSGQDIHTATASRVFGVAPEDVTLPMRSKAKMVSYGLAYGMEAFGLAQRLNIGRKEASEILDAYFVAFPAVRAYMDATVQEARSRGYTETLFGRRRPIPELSSPNFQIRQAGERQAMNAGIQGLAADIFKVALIRLDEALDQASFDARLILQVHDEVVVEVAEGDEDDVKELTLGVLHNAAELRVPLEVNVSMGHSWSAAKG